MNIVKSRLYNQTSEGDPGAGGAAVVTGGAVIGAGGVAPAGADAVVQTPATGQEQQAKPQEQPSGQKQVPATWPADWRKQMAGDDEKALKQLERYNSPSDIYNKARSLEQRLSSGELKANVPFPDKGTPEEQNKWRAENGIPESPDKYELKLRDGVVIGEVDKPVIDEFLKDMHGKNLSPAVASDVVQWYFDTVEKQAEAQFQRDLELKQTFEDTMRAEWGQEYRGNINAIKSLTDLGGAGLFDKIANARMADGTPFGSSPDIMKWMALVARTINPTSTITPMDNANIAQSVADEIKQIETVMRTNRREYDKDVKMQERLTQLYEFRDRGKNPAAA